MKRSTLNQNPRDPAFFQNPYPVYANLHARANTGIPLVFWEEYNLWCIFGFDGVNDALKDRRFGRQILHRYSREEVALQEPSPHLEDFYRVEAWSLLALEPPVHTQLRKLVTRAFVNRSVEKMKPRIISYAHELVDCLVEKQGTTEGGQGSVDLLSHYATPLPARIIAELIGVPFQHIPDLLKWSNTMVRVYTMTQSRDEELAANTAAREFSLLVESLIDERRKQPQEDLLSHLTNTTLEGERLSDAQIISTVILLLNAGHEATVHQIGNAVKAVIESPWHPKELFDGESQTRDTVQEIMRFDTPLHLFTRYALEPVELDNGVQLMPGEEIGLLLGAANHDPVRFADPQRFDPFRADGGHVSLGAGIHYCLGAVLAQLELSVALQVLFERLPDLELEQTPEYRDSFHFHGLASLKIA